MDEMNLSPQAFKEAPMVALSAVSVALALARVRGVLTISREFNARLGVEFWALSDDRGLICTALSEAEALGMAS